MRSNVGVQRILGIALNEKSTDGEEELSDGQRRTPVALQDVNADLSLSVDVTMVNSSPKLHLQLRLARRLP